MHLGMSTIERRLRRSKKPETGAPLYIHRRSSLLRQLRLGSSSHNRSLNLSRAACFIHGAAHFVPCSRHPDWTVLFTVSSLRHPGAAALSTTPPFSSLVIAIWTGLSCPRSQDSATHGLNLGVIPRDCSTIIL